MEGRTRVKQSSIGRPTDDLLAGECQPSFDPPNKTGLYSRNLDFPLVRRAYSSPPPIFTSKEYPCENI